MKTKYVFAFCNKFLKKDSILIRCCLTTPVLKTLQYLQKSIRDGFQCEGSCNMYSRSLFERSALPSMFLRDLRNDQQK